MPVSRRTPFSDVTYDHARLHYRPNQAPGRGRSLGRRADCTRPSGHDLGGPESHARHVADGGARLDAEGSAVPHKIGDLCASYQSLGRDAGDVDAGATDHADFNERDLSPRFRLVHRQRLAGLAAAQHSMSLVFQCGHAVISLRRALVEAGRMAGSTNRQTPS